MTRTLDVAVPVVMLGVIGALAVVTRQPLLFPSLGPSVLLFVDSPHLPSSRPLNTAVGHVLGIAAGWLALALTGLLHAPPVTVAGATWARVAAAVVSLALTGVVLRLLHLPHPPAGASTLIVSLGILSAPRELAAMVVAVLLLAALGALLDAVRVRALQTRDSDPSPADA